ncbi:unnamed protein product [Clavelina lepadiformis]|uniref:RNA-polymerase II-associated protein 3-like C-terminal domain-containing protein n=1 Tax=Clavelina lepadiformis TaxID=159417 RepID=A0ABP0FVD5_CLALP
MVCRRISTYLDFVINTHIDSSEFDRAFLVLQHLARSQRFDLAAMFLSQSDKNIVGLPVAVCASREIQHKGNCHQ